jgi:hypothetical protein
MRGEQQKLTQGDVALGQLLDQMRMAANFYHTEAPTMADLKSGKFEGLLSKGFPTPTTPTQQPAASAPLALQPQQPLGATAAASSAGGAPQAQPAVDTGGPPDALLTAIHRNESGGRIEGVPDSKAGAVGPMQVLPSTAAQYGVGPNELRNPAINLSVGKQYASDLWQKYGGDPEAVAVAYNAGPRRADIWLASGKVDKLLPQETQGYLTKVRNQLGGEGAQYAQNAANPATMTDAGAGGGAPAPAAGVMDPMAIRQGLAAQQWMFPSTKTTPALDAMISAGMMPANSSAQQLLMNEALKESGVKPILGGERAGVPIRRYNQATGNYDIIGQTPIMRPGQLLGPNYSISNAPGSVESAAAMEAGIDWSKVPPASFLKGLRVNPNMSVSPVPGSPQAEATMSGAKAGGAAAAEAGVKYGPLLGGGQAPGELTQLAPQAGAPQGAPQPIPSQSRFGTLIPPPTPTSQPNFRSPAEAERAMAKWGDTTAKWTEAVEPAAQAEQRLHTIAEALKVVQSGKFTEQKANLAATFESLGIPAKWLTDPAQAQLALHENAVGTLARLKSYTSRFTQQEFKTITSVSENPNLTPEANQQMLAEDMATLRRAQALPIDWAQAHSLGWSNPESFEAAYNNTNPLGPLVEKIKKEIGPLKGMPGAAPQGNQAPVPQRPVTAVGPNGHRIELRNGAWVDQVTGKPVQ